MGSIESDATLEALASVRSPTLLLLRLLLRRGGDQPHQAATRAAGYG